MDLYSWLWILLYILIITSGFICCWKTGQRTALYFYCNFLCYFLFNQIIILFIFLCIFRICLTLYQFLVLFILRQLNILIHYSLILTTMNIYPFLHLVLLIPKFNILVKMNRTQLIQFATNPWPKSYCRLGQLMLFLHLIVINV